MDEARAAPDTCDEEPDRARREFLRAVAVKGALASLFGAISMDALCAQVSGEHHERAQLAELRRAAMSAADEYRSLDLKDPRCRTGYNCDSESVYCVEHSCGLVYGCTIRDLTCDLGDFTCPTQYNCTEEHHTCAPYHFTCTALFNPNY